MTPNHNDSLDALIEHAIAREDLDELKGLHAIVLRLNVWQRW
jgi:hypothetical protein